MLMGFNWLPCNVVVVETSNKNDLNSFQANRGTKIKQLKFYLVLKNWLQQQNDKFYSRYVRTTQSLFVYI